MKHFFLFCILLMVPQYVQAEVYVDECANLIGSCDYYACIDQNRLNCGNQGYALGYGKKYCEKFSAIDFTDARTPFGAAVFPGQGNVWRDNVRTCLQQGLESWFANDSAKDCSSLRAFAFNSHPDCYTQEPSFCELTPENVAKIGLTIQLNDFFKAESQQQIRATSRICVSQLDERIQYEDRGFVRFQLVEYRKIWVLVARDPAMIGRLFGFAPH